MGFERIRNFLKRRWKGRVSGSRSHALITRLYNLIGNNPCGVSGEGNRIESSDALFLNTRIDIVGSNNTIIIAPGCTITNTIFRIRGDGHRITIGESCSYQGGELWIEDHDCVLMIGANTTVVQAHIAVTEPGSVIKIGKECMFAHGIEIRCGDSHSIIDLADGKRINYARNISIGDHVWIATDVLILKGVEIGNDSVVASRALVTKSFPANSLIGGSPASVIKENITWNRKRIFEKESEK